MCSLPGKAESNPVQLSLLTFQIFLMKSIPIQKGYLAQKYIQKHNCVTIIKTTNYNNKVYQIKELMHI